MTCSSRTSLHDLEYDMPVPGILHMIWNTTRCAFALPYLDLSVYFLIFASAFFGSEFYPSFTISTNVMKYPHLIFYALVFMTCIPGCEEKGEGKIKKLQVERVVITSPDQIEPLRDTLVKPVLYLNVSGLDSLTVEKSKEKFIAAVLPAILIARHRLEENLLRLEQLTQKEEWDVTDSVFYRSLATRFKAEDAQVLKRRMTCHPNSIILAQAAVESGWGQSRFFQEGNNLFGIWSYNPDEPRMTASLSRGEKKVYLRKYEDISQSIMDYIETVGRSRAYRHFRYAREETDDPFALIPHLKYYSERRGAYVTQLKTIIVQNDFTRYDSYQLDPQYFTEE